MEKIASDKIVELALERYDKIFSAVEYFSKETSIIYKLTDFDSEEFALKIYDNASNLDDNELEILILEAIYEKGSILAPELIKNKENQCVTLVKDALSNTNHRIVLSKWLKGKALKNNESKELFYDLGQVVAKLHSITKEIEIPKHINPKKWDQVFYFRDEIPVYHNDEYSNIVCSEFIALMDKAIPIFNKKLKEIYESANVQLLHGDLNPWNIKVDKDQIAILDFEDVVLGQPIHDLSILLFYYKRNNQFSFEFIKKTILEGYNSIHPREIINEEYLAFLSMSRTINFLNYVLTLDGDFKEFIGRSLKDLKAFLEGMEE